MPSKAYAVNVYAANLTGSGISVTGNASFLVSLTNTTSPSAWATSQNLPISGGVAYVSFVSTTLGNQSTNIVVSSTGDSRVNSINVPVSGTILQNVVPFVTVSDAQLPVFNPNDIKTFTVSGNLLSSPVVITGSNSFLVSLDGSSFNTTATLNPSFKLLAPSKVYVKYILTTTAAGGLDNGSVSVASEGGNTETVNLSGQYGLNLVVGPLDANGNIQQISIVPSFPTMNSFTGLPSPSKYTYIGATNIPVGGVIQVTASSTFQLSYDDFASGPLTTLTFAGVGGSLAPTPIYVRYQGTGSTIGAPVVKVGLQGNSAFDKLIGLQGVSAIAIGAAPKTGTISTSATNTILGVGTTFTTYNLGAPLYSPNSVAGSFLGLISNIINDTTVVLDRVPSNQSLSAATFFSSSSAMVNVTSDQFESNKDINRGALLFPYTSLSSTSMAIPSAPLSFTVTGLNSKSFTVGRDLTTYYSLYVELSFDGGNTWVASKTITSAGIATQVVLVRYNPTGNLANGTVNGVVYGPNLGQHTGAISAGGVTVYTIGYSDPILNVSSSPIPAKGASANNTFATLADLNTLADRPSFPVPIYVAGNSLQGDVTVSSPNSNIEFSSTPDFTSPQSSITLSAPSFTVN
ncbi:MAG: hypothetical protein K2Q22_14920, partial [Cytophagales bacterium]|nr:hypothetical protein [Cytophagales bacterium]